MKISKPNLEAALRTVSNTVGSGGSDISTHYYFRAREGALEVLSANARTWASCPVKDAEVTGDERFTLEAKRVHCLLDAVGAASELTFDLDGTEVVVRTDRGKNVFSSLDPNLFPVWDDQLAAARVTAKISADRLHAAFTHGRMFVYDNEGKAPQICVLEFRGGCLYSTDQSAVSIIKIPGMEQSTLRVYGKDAGHLLSFLAGARGTDVEVREGERSAFIVRADGAVFGEAIYGSRFPDVNADWRLVDDETWTVFKEEILGNVKFLTAGARWEDARLRLKRRGDAVTMSMTAAGGKDIALQLKLPAVEVQENVAAPIPEDGFAVSHFYLSQILADLPVASARLGVSRKGAGGWMRIRDEREHGDVYLTTVAWLKNA